MICLCHQQTCFDFYNQTRKRGIKFGRFYVLKESIDKSGVKVLFLGKTAKETILLNVKYEIIAKVLKKLARIVFLNVDQLRFLKKVAFGKIKFKKPKRSCNQIEDKGVKENTTEKIPEKVICEKCGNCIETAQDCTEVDINEYSDIKIDDENSIPKPRKDSLHDDGSKISEYTDYNIDSDSNDIDYKDSDSGSEDSDSQANSEEFIESNIDELSEDSNLNKATKSPIDFNAVLESEDLQCKKCAKMGFSNQIERILHETSHLKIHLRSRKKKKTKKKVGEIPRDGIFCPVCGEHFNVIESLRSHQYDRYGDEYVGMIESKSSDESDNEILQAHLMNQPKNKSAETPNDEEEGKLCEVCAKVISKKAFHYHPELLKTCEFCNRKFQRNIESHLKEHDKKLECDICGFRYKTFKNLRIHVIRHIRNSNYIRRFECNICKKVLATRSSLNVHKRIHLKSRPFKCPYPGCRYTSITNAALKSHLVIHNKSNSTYKCKVCGKEYARRQGLDKHRRMIHPKKAECYQCDLCPATYKDKSYIRRHINEEHLFKDTYCKICNIKFKLKYHLMSHMVTHNTKSEMQRKNQDGKYKCNECFRTFAYESDLKKHSHRRKFGFNCSKCSKKFPSQTELWLHVDVHKAEYPFKCEVCKERFKQINYLNRHAWKHKKIENPFICDHCGKEFQRKNHLGTHLKFFKEKKLGKKYKTGFSAKKLMKEIFSKT